MRAVDKFMFITSITETQRLSPKLYQRSSVAQLLQRESKFTKRGSANNNNDNLFNSQVKITSDKENNALVVTASPTDWACQLKVLFKNWIYQETKSM